MHVDDGEGGWEVGVLRGGTTWECGGGNRHGAAREVGECTLVEVITAPVARSGSSDGRGAVHSRWI